MGCRSGSHCDHERTRCVRPNAGTARQRIAAHGRREGGAGAAHGEGGTGTDGVSHTDAL
ncbi:hypothetical protein U2075_14835 [Listeria monocytogenes]|uniref:hypothetical protein n=1 Tax=Listeria monocytogenes TaxID=1639 RepID=UPI002FDBDD89